ncbi:Bacterial regulatory protein, MarR, partial [mine drainage metagenome]
MADPETSITVWRSFVETWKTWKKAVDTNFDVMGIGTTTYSLLRNIYDSGPVPMTELAGLIMVTPGWLTGLVDSLEQKELVERVRNVDDRRIIDIKITGSGRTLFEKAREIHMDFIKECLEHLDNEAALLLIESLEKLKSSVLSAKKTPKIP